MKGALHYVAACAYVSGEHPAMSAVCCTARRDTYDAVINHRNTQAQSCRHHQPTPKQEDREEKRTFVNMTTAGSYTVAV